MINVNERERVGVEGVGDEREKGKTEQRAQHNKGKQQQPTATMQNRERHLTPHRQSQNYKDHKTEMSPGMQVHDTDHAKAVIKRQIKTKNGEGGQRETTPAP